MHPLGFPHVGLSRRTSVRVDQLAQRNEAICGSFARLDDGHSLKLRTKLSPVLSQIGGHLKVQRKLGRRIQNTSKTQRYIAVTERRSS